MKKPVDKQKWLLYIILSIVIGYILAGLLGRALKQEGYRIDESMLKPCTESVEICESGIIPSYTLGASGGAYGFPFPADHYYCISDDSCGVIRRSYLTSFFPLAWINTIIWIAVSFAALIMGSKLKSSFAAKSR
jgi:hypothetical protein